MHWPPRARISETTRPTHSSTVLTALTVQDHHVVLAGIDGLQNGVGDFIGAHLGLEIERGNFFRGRRGDEDAILALEDALFAAVEEERDVRVLLRLGDAQLRLAAFGKIFAHRHRQRFGRIRHGHVGHGRIVLRHANERDGEIALLADEALEVGVDERAGDLAGTVGAEVKEHDGVVLLHHAVFVGHGGQDELVGQMLAGLVDDLVGIKDRLHGIGRFDALAEDHRIVRLLDALPRVVAVHRIKTAHDGGDAADADLFNFLFQLFDVFRGGIRRNVAAVEERMNINLGKAVQLGHAKQPVQMLLMRMHAAGGDKPHQMQRGIVRLAVFDRAQNGLVLEEDAVLDVFGDLHQHLIDDAARADIGVADFGVAHLAVGKTHVKPRRADLGMGIFCRQRIQMGRAGGDDGIVPRVGIDAEAVHDDQSRHRFCHWLILRSVEIRNAPRRRSRRPSGTRRR